MQDWSDRILEYINENKVSTTEVADCLGKTGVLPNVYPINRGQFRAGKVKWIYAYNESNYDVHKQIIDLDKGYIVFIEAFDCGDRAIIGELVSKYLLLYRRSVAIVTNAKMRDAHRLIKENYPIWCNGVSPIGCFNQKSQVKFDSSIYKEHFDRYDNSIAVCDDSGVVFIPKTELTEAFYHKLEDIEEQEDIWFDCIDRRKWNTFDTVCLKKYLEDRK